jgi:DNA-binding response OmpR family regulator
MRYFVYWNNNVAGPYAAGEIPALHGGVSEDTLVYPESGHGSDKKTWRRIADEAELRALLKSGALALAGPEPAAHGRLLNILSTDDDPNIRSLLWHLLAGAGHTVEFAKDGEEVFKRIAVKPYDLLILDVNMPKMNGYKVSELVHEKLSKPPKVIIFTGRDLDKERLQFVCSGADAILNKGTGNDKMLRTINELFHLGPRAGGIGGKAARPQTPEPAEPAIEPVPPAIQAASDEKQRTAAGPEPVVPAAAVSSGERIAAGPSARTAQTQPDLSKQERLLELLVAENEKMKLDLKEIKKSLSHVAAEYGQLDLHFTNRLTQSSEENSGHFKRLRKEMLRMRRHSGALLLLLLAIAAWIISRSFR